MNNVNLLQSVSFGLNLFYFTTEQQGDVWQFQLPVFNNLTYTLPLCSTRILFNTEFTFRPIFKRVFPFVEGGIGLAINEASYADTPKPNNTVPPTLLNHHTQSQFAYSVGGGFRIPFRKDMEASIRFVYSDLGRAKTASTGNLPVQGPISIELTSQSWLLGFSYLIG